MIVVSNTSPLTNLAAIGQLGILDAVRPSLDLLREKVGFYLSEPLYQHALSVAREGDV